MDIFLYDLRCIEDFVYETDHSVKLHLGIGESRKWDIL